MNQAATRRGVVAALSVNGHLGMQRQPTSRQPHRGDGLCLLSLDAGGARGISQLKVLADLMHRINQEGNTAENIRPCSVFDIIGGVGSGGFAAILLVIFGLTADQVLAEFIELSANVLELEGGADARTAALRSYIDNLFDIYGILKEMPLMHPNDRSRGCKLVVPISYKYHVGSTSILRNFQIRQEPPLNMTVYEALLSTLATPPLFSPTSIFKDSASFTYISGDLILSNPVREIVAQACEAFGPEEHVACLLSIGCGHPGIFSVPEGSSLVAWNNFFRKVIADSEKEAQNADRQMGHLGLYLRFSVNRGLDISSSNPDPTPEEILAHTNSYLTDISISDELDRCAELLQLRDGISSLEQLRRSGGEIILPPPPPPLTNPFVVRAGPMEFIIRAIFGTGQSDEPTRRKIVSVTGIGGCGKTQIIRKFIEDYGDQFESAFFIDGSSETRLRADMVRNVRSLGTEHSQKSFKDCISWLSQPVSGLPRLIVYDNVDDPHLNILPLIPQGTGCVIIITSRNHSIGQLSPEAHLELDVMNMDEAIELLMYASDPSIQSEEQAREEARAVAEELGCLPIALAQARSYMFQTKCSADAYLKRIIVYRDRLLARPVQHKEGMRYTSTYAAFEASFDILPERDQKLLWLFSFYHWAGVPLELVTLAAKHGFSSYEREYMAPGEEFRTGNEVLQEIFYDNGQFDLLNLDEMMINLQNSSLATLMPGIGTNLFRMHPLAHGWVHSSIPEQERAKYQAAAVLLLALGARNDYTPSGQYLASHVNHLSRIWNHLHVNDAGAFGYILGDAGLSNAALQLQETVVTELRKHKHATLQDSLWLLALNYRSMGRSNEANEVLEELLQLRKNAAKDASPEDFAAFKKVVIVYNAMGRHANSAELQAEVLKTRIAVMGEEHADTIHAKNSLGVTYRYLGRLEDAERLNLEVLRWRQRVLGARHPLTVTSTYQLSYTYRSMKRFEEAAGLQRDVLALRKELLGERHPNTISAADTLAMTYTEMGRHEDAEELRLRVLKLSREVLGEHHYDTIDAMLYLAETYEKLSKKEEALLLLRPAEGMLFETLGESHPQYKRLREIMSQVQAPGGDDGLSQPDETSSSTSFVEVVSPSVPPAAPSPLGAEEGSGNSYFGTVLRYLGYGS